MMSKIDIKNAFWQISVEMARVFGHVFGGLIEVDRRLQFGWRNSPGLRYLFASALEHSHIHTLHRGAVTTGQSKEAILHVRFESPGKVAFVVSLPPGCVFPPESGET